MQIFEIPIHKNDIVKKMLKKKKVGGSSQLLYTFWMQISALWRHTVKRLAKHKIETKGKEKKIETWFCLDRVFGRKKKRFRQSFNVSWEILLESLFSHWGKLGTVY